MPFVGCCALVYFWTLRFSRIGDFYTLRLGFFGNLDLRIIDVIIAEGAGLVREGTIIESQTTQE